METNDDAGTETQNRKRPLEEEAATGGAVTESPQVPPRKIPKLKDVPVNINGKNPVALLNELRPGLSYQVLTKTGPVHAPLFTMSVEIDGQVYEGVGTNKKTAKAKAAENALRSFIQFPNSALEPPARNVDFTADVLTDNEAEGDGADGNKKLPLGFIAAFPKLKPADLAKGPVMLLNELYPGLKYHCVSAKDDSFEKFRTTVEVQGETFVGIGKMHSVILCLYFCFISLPCSCSNINVTHVYKCRFEQKKLKMRRCQSCFIQNIKCAAGARIEKSTSYCKVAVCQYVSGPGAG